MVGQAAVGVAHAQGHRAGTAVRAVGDGRGGGCGGLAHVGGGGAGTAVQGGGHGVGAGGGDGQRVACGAARPSQGGVRGGDGGVQGAGGAVTEGARAADADRRGGFARYGEGGVAGTAVDVGAGHGVGAAGGDGQSGGSAGACAAPTVGARARGGQRGLGAGAEGGRTVDGNRGRVVHADGRRGGAGAAIQGAGHGVGAGRARVDGGGVGAVAPGVGRRAAGCQGGVRARTDGRRGVGAAVDGHRGQRVHGDVCGGGAGAAARGAGHGHRVGAGRVGREGGRGVAAQTVAPAVAVGTRSRHGDALTRAGGVVAVVAQGDGGTGVGEVDAVVLIDGILLVLVAYPDDGVGLCDRGTVHDGGAGVRRLACAGHRRRTARARNRGGVVVLGHVRVERGKVRPIHLQGCKAGVVDEDNVVNFEDIVLCPSSWGYVRGECGQHIRRSGTVVCISKGNFFQLPHTTSVKVKLRVCNLFRLVLSGGHASSTLARSCAGWVWILVDDIVVCYSATMNFDAGMRQG